MSEEIINVLNYLFGQLGIAVDWTSENVWPQVIDILGRYRIFQIIRYVLLIIACICGIIILMVIWKKAIKAYIICTKEHNENFWWYYSSYNRDIRMQGYTEALVAATIVGGILTLLGIIFSTDALLNWTFVPEIKYLELLNGYIN